MFSNILVYVGELALLQCAVVVAGELALVHSVFWSMFLSIHSSILLYILVYVVELAPVQSVCWNMFSNICTY